jgi:uncharacterized membrane protein
MTNDKIKLLVKYAIMIALTAVSTMFISIPAPGATGYFNLGDSMVFIAAILLGPKGGLIGGGIGSALADVLLGYTLWAPFTLIIKGLEGYLAGYLLDTAFGKKRPTLVLIPAALWMVIGYYGVSAFLYGWEAAFLEVPICLIQGAVGIGVARAFSLAVSKTKLFNNAPQTR